MTRKEKIDFLTINIKGVGPAKAEKIVNYFENIDNFMSVAYDKEFQSQLKELIGVSLAQSFINQLLDIRRQDEHIQQMVACGIPYFSATSIAKTEELFKAFKKDPYTIGRQHGLQFVHCDKFAHILFCETTPPDMSKARMQFFIDATLSKLESSGHTYAYLTQLTKELNKYQRANEYIPDNYENSTTLLYLLNNHDVEIEKHRDIRRWKIARKVTAELENDIAYHIKRLANSHEQFAEHEFEPKKIKYDKVQMTAIQSASKGGLKIITGPPGSGKTAVINGIINYFLDIKKDAEIILCAPTGRAAKHMTEITGKQSATIHKLLGLREDRQFIKKAKLQCDMVICDEASMLTLDATYELLSRIPTGAVVYFVGDKDQLPAVGAGNVLHDIIDSEVVPVYHLTKVYRQDGIILENAHQINKGVVPTKTNTQYQFESFNDASALKAQAVEWFKQHYNQNEPFESQILIPSYKTDCGIDSINEAIQALNPEPYIYKSPKHSYKRNDKILMTHNDRQGRYQNGSVGLFLYNLGDEIVVELEGEEVTLSKDAIDNMTLGYAISVHKAQGSEYKHVLFCLPDKPVNMLKRNIAYTAATRAKDDLTIYEMVGALQKAVESDKESLMQTGLKQRLKTS